MSNLVKRLRDWEHVHPEDYNKDAGHLYEEAADRIEALEAESALDAERLRITIERAEMAEDERDALREAIAQWVAAREAAMSDVSPATFTELSKAESALARTNKEKSDAPQQQTA